MIPNVIGALASYLLADSGVAARAGTRVYPMELTFTTEGKLAGTDLEMPQDCILLRPAGGSDDRNIHALRVDALCYGETMRSAELVRLDLHAAMRPLDRVKQGTVLLHGATLSSGASAFRDRDTAWPAMVETWLVRFGAEAA